MIFDIVLILVIEHRPALPLWMPLLPALETEQIAAHALDLWLALASFHKMPAVWRRTPSQTLINIHDVVLSKAKVFLIEGFIHESLHYSF